MNKAVLVIDMPERCKECMCYVLGASNNFCEVTKFVILDNTTKPDWCPLKELPEKYDMDNMVCDRDWDGEYEYGYNACIDEILGK